MNKLLLLTLLLAATLLAAAPVLTNVAAGQLNDQVLISYQLAHPDDLPCDVSLQVSNDGGASYTIFPAALSGDFGTIAAKENYLTAAVQEGWKVIDLKDHKAKSRLAAPVNAQMDDFDKAALALNSGAWSSLITTKEGPFLILAESRNKPNLQAFDKAKQEELRDRLEEAAFNRWFQQLRKDAKIVDNRYKYGY